jgi:hypothetical protein
MHLISTKKSQVCFTVRPYTTGKPLAASEEIAGENNWHVQLLIK